MGIDWFLLIGLIDQCRCVDRFVNRAVSLYNLFTFRN